MDGEFCATVVHEWQGEKNFFFDTEEERDRFRAIVNGGGNEGLEALVEAGDVTSEMVELIDFEAR